jgi:hypothetical protein
MKENLFMKWIRFSFCLLTVVSCSEEIGQIKDVNPETVYFDYSVNQNKDGEAEYIFRYRFAGANGTTLFLNPPSEIRFDGQVIKSDSSNTMGVYYGYKLPASQANGKHFIDFKAYDGKHYKQNIEWHTVKVPGSLNAFLVRGVDMDLPLSGSLSGDHIQVLMSDTASLTDDVELDLPISNGQITIPGNTLTTLADGPVQISLFRYFDIPMKSLTAEGGLFQAYQDIALIDTKLGEAPPIADY